MSHTYNQSVAHHIPAIENILEPWRWDREHSDSDHYDNHVLVLNAEKPVTINLYGAPEEFNQNDPMNVIVSRGANITLIYKTGIETVKTHILVKDVHYEMRYSHRLETFRTTAPRIRHDIGLIFNLTKFDLLPILFPLGLSNSHQFLAGRLSFQCDWPGSKTLSLWRDGIHKILKFYNVKSGHHCLDYSIPRSIVSAWTTSGKTRIMPLDLRVEDGGVERMVWTGATKLDVPDLSFLRPENE